MANEMCHVPGCTRPVRSRGICDGHLYHRNKQTALGEQVRAAMLPSKRGAKSQAHPGTTFMAGTQQADVVRTAKAVADALQIKAIDFADGLVLIDPATARLAVVHRDGFVQPVSLMTKE